MTLVALILAAGMADWSVDQWGEFLAKLVSFFGSIAAIILWLVTRSRVHSVKQQSEQNATDIRDVRKDVVDVATKSIPTETAKLLLYSSPPAEPGESWYKPTPEPKPTEPQEPRIP